MTSLDADFYDQQSLLTEDEREIVLRVRSFMEKEVAPIANEAWAKAEFPHRLVPGFAALDVAGRSGSPSRTAARTWPPGWRRRRAATATRGC
jgi:glutaryl-CoA dehydrogenase